ncbi:MAG: glycosyltransferase [Pseudomonadota bacterium]
MAVSKAYQFMHRVLLITRHFPPLVTGGARRPYLLENGLKTAGISVKVVAPIIPDDVDGVAAPHPSPAPSVGADASGQRRSTVRSFIRTHMFLPDPDIRWSLRAVKAAQRARFAPDWIITTSPPESIHIAGRLLASRWRAGWIADFRDNWLVDPLLPQRHSGVRRKLEQPIAKWALSRADIISAPSNRMLDEAKSYAPQAKSLLLPQPSPSPANVNNKGKSNAERTHEFIVLHTGSFSLSHAGRTIAETLSLFKSAKEQRSNLRLHLIGRLTQDEQELARAIDGVHILGLKTMMETWEAQRSADLLLLAAAPDTEIVPGKLSEYHASGRPLVVVGGGAWAKTENKGLTPLTRMLHIIDNQRLDVPKRPIFTAEDAAAALIEATEGFSPRRSA